MLNTIVKLLALACFIAFVAFLPIFVREPDLIVVSVIVVGMAIFDFLVYSPRRERQRP